jgi:purine-nucleoside phosphorylase
MEIEAEIDFASIPHFPKSTVKDIQEIITGRNEGEEGSGMSGRFHYYEGYNAAQVAFPIRVMRHWA